MAGSSPANTRGFHGWSSAFGLTGSFESALTLKAKGWPTALAQQRFPGILLESGIGYASNYLRRAFVVRSLLLRQSFANGESWLRAQILRCLMQQKSSEHSFRLQGATAAGGGKKREEMPAPRCFDEISSTDGAIRQAYGKIASWLAATPASLLNARRSQAELLFRRIGITFAVYGDHGGEGTERLIPFDIVPRVILRSEWARLEAGLMQRVKALNLFLVPTIPEV